jgi:hypothetical protein
MQWPNDKGQTMQWRNDKGQTMQWRNDKGQTMQWRIEKKTNHLLCFPGCLRSLYRSGVVE